MKYSLLKIWLLLMFCSFVTNVPAQSANAQETENMKKAVESKSYTFQTQSMTAMKGGTRQLNPGYTLVLKGDTLIANLPYVGRVYQPSIGGTGGFQFTSNQFNYQVKTRKKGGWNVMIKTKDQSSNCQFNLTISPNGSTTMSVISNDRESISYFGFIEVNKPD